jgi:acetate CoA/acetoacetate CoA-transferase alpha subunit
MISKQKFKSIFKDGMSIMIGGYMCDGTPENLVDFIRETGVKELTIIISDLANWDRSIGRLVLEGNVRHVVTTKLGDYSNLISLVMDKKLRLDLLSQGTLVERIRAGGNGLGGFLTPVGIGSVLEEGKQIIDVYGTKYLLELPIRADVALIKGSIVDSNGNIVYKGTSRNINPIMATAADLVVVEASVIVKSGDLQPELIMTPSPLVDYIYQA